MPLGRLVVEALAVGTATSVVGLLISTLIMYAVTPAFSLTRYKFWPYVLLAFFITGVCLHVGFELVGANKWYCRNGNACRK
jgi:hypothetical protein